MRPKYLVPLRTLKAAASLPLLLRMGVPQPLKHALIKLAATVATG